MPSLLSVASDRDGRRRTREPALFLIIACWAAGGPGTVLARNLVHAALFLVAFFFLIACQFVAAGGGVPRGRPGAGLHRRRGDPADVRDHADAEHPGGRHDDRLPRAAGIPALLGGARLLRVLGLTGSAGTTPGLSGRRPAADQAGPTRPSRRPEAAAINNMGKARRHRADEPVRRPLRGRRLAADRRAGRRGRAGPPRTADDDDRPTAGASARHGTGVRPTVAGARPGAVTTDRPRRTDRPERSR